MARSKNRTDFILDAARAAAQHALFDQTLMTVSPQSYPAFLKRLDARRGRMRDYVKAC